MALKEPVRVLLECCFISFVFLLLSFFHLPYYSFACLGVGEVKEVVAGGEGGEVCGACGGSEGGAEQLPACKVGDYEGARVGEPTVVQHIAGGVGPQGDAAFYRCGYAYCVAHHYMGVAVGTIIAVAAL
jgi:hypothetical protein